MVLIDFLFFFAVGCVVGLLAGLFGVGGGFVMVPILILGYEQVGLSSSVLTHGAIGTSLFVVLVASVTSAYQHSKQRNIDWRSALVMGFSSAATAFGTARLVAGLSGRHLCIAFVIIVGVAAVRMLTEGEQKTQETLELLSTPTPSVLQGLVLPPELSPLSVVGYVTTGMGRSGLPAWSLGALEFNERIA